METASAPLVEFVRDPTRFIEQIRDETGPLILTEAGDAAMVLLSADAYDRIRRGLTGREKP